MVDLLAALAQAFDVDLARVERRPTLTLTADERGRAETSWGARGAGARVLVNVSAGTQARNWPNERYVAVMEYLRARDPDAVFRVIGAPAEAARATDVASAGGGEFVRTPSIRDAFALVATADFVFTPDTSIAHAASAFRVPCVAMYLRGTSERWGLYGIFGESVEHPESTLATLSVDRMLRAVDTVWSEAVVSRG
jgi:ADP-heptose:LPS heptosyltransferase